MSRIYTTWLAIGAVAVLMATVGAGSANAAWGLTTCSSTKWCWAQSEDNLHVYSIVGLEETRGENSICNDGTLYQKIAGFPEPHNLGGNNWPEERGDPKYIAIGQLFGHGYCDNAPHVYTSEIDPTTGVYHLVLSVAPTWEHQYNMYAISDGSRNGAFQAYYRIPSESGVWTEYASWGGGWSAQMNSENNGMNAGTESIPGYEGAGEVLWTDGSIEWPVKTGGGWTGSTYYGEYGDTCIAPITGPTEGPGNTAFASCPL